MKMMYNNDEANITVVEAIVENDMEIYDDQERVIGTWFGKPLYRKVIPLKFTTTTSNPYVVGTFDVNYETIVSFFGMNVGPPVVPITSHYWGNYV